MLMRTIRLLTLVLTLTACVTAPEQPTPLTIRQAVLLELAAARVSQP
jgi:hypothetical protein